MDKRLWNFTDKHGAFESHAAHEIKSLYLPLGNETLMSSITPDLHGDVKAGNNSFLLTPVSRIDLSDSRSSRNFWISSGPTVWSAAGVSKDIAQLKSDRVRLNAGLLWQEVERENETVGIRARILSFVPASPEPVEIMRVTLTNSSSRELELIPTAAVPIYGRSAHNVRDHRHVTSLLQRIATNEYGVVVTPTLLFDESGHKPNNIRYFVVGWDEFGTGPEALFPTQEIFCGDAGDLEMPQSVYAQLPPAERPLQGREAMGALRFARLTLAPGQSRTYVMLLGIAADEQRLTQAIKAFNSTAKVEAAFEDMKRRWTAISEQTALSTGDADLDGWFRWVSVQPTLRRIFGCSFLPDFDYGKGGRGWRDLWQDCLGLLLREPDAVRGVLINNFGGVKLDGSNATIIGSRPGEFIADRNNISRVWMDHGVWPLLTLDLYMQETGDRGILFEKTTYFHDHQIARSRDRIRAWDASYGNRARSASGAAYQGTILEHLLVQALVQFYNVGGHNHVCLEGADWNDGLDMAKEKGESVAFSAMYAHNLRLLAQLLRAAGKKRVRVFKELKLLLKKVNCDAPASKRTLMEGYFAKVRMGVSGATVELDCESLARELEGKAAWMMAHIRKTEWLREGFFNGYYDNNGRRVEGMKKGRTRMMLASQVFPVMSGTADDRQVREIVRNVARHLKDGRFGGYHLNTDFGEEQHALGRAFSFVYGDKENGAYFNHMIVMYAYALYKRGFSEEAWEVVHSIIRMALDTVSSKNYPCLPEYFDSEGRGMYCYLTGSASWFVLTMLTQSFGVKGRDGDLLIEPKLSGRQFKHAATIGVNRVFAGRTFHVEFSNDRRLPAGAYAVTGATLNGQTLALRDDHSLVIPRSVILKLPKDVIHRIQVALG